MQRVNRWRRRRGEPGTPQYPHAPPKTQGKGKERTFVDLQVQLLVVLIEASEGILNRRIPNMEEE